MKSFSASVVTIMTLIPVKPRARSWVNISMPFITGMFQSTSATSKWLACKNELECRLAVARFLTFDSLRFQQTAHVATYKARVVNNQCSHDLSP